MKRHAVTLTVWVDAPDTFSQNNVLNTISLAAWHLGDIYAVQTVAVLIDEAEEVVS